MYVEGVGQAGCLSGECVFGCPVAAPFAHTTHSNHSCPPALICCNLASAACSSSRRCSWRWRLLVGSQARVPPGCCRLLNAKPGVPAAASSVRITPARVSSSRCSKAGCHGRRWGAASSQAEARQDGASPHCLHFMIVPIPAACIAMGSGNEPARCGLLSCPSAPALRLPTARVRHRQPDPCLQTPAAGRPPPHRCASALLG